MRAGRIVSFPRRALDAALDATIVGGVLAMPVGGLAPIVSPALPSGGPFHHSDGLIYGIAVLWFVSALIGAHLRQPRRKNGNVKPTET